MRTLIVLVFSLSILPSCQDEINNPSTVEVNLKEAKILNINRTGITCLMPMGLFFVNGKYVLQDQATDTIFTVIDPGSKKVEFFFGTKGDGPNEFNNNYIFANNKTNGAYPFLGFNSVDKTFYELDFKRGDGPTASYVLDKSPYSIPGEVNMIQNYAVLNKNQFVLTNDVREKLFTLDLSGNTPSISQTVQFSDEEKNILGEGQKKIGTKVGVLPGIISVSPDGKVVGCASRNLGYFQLYDDKMVPISDEVFIGESAKPRISKYLSDLSKPHFYIIDFVLGSNYIYVLFLDESMEVASSLAPSVKSKILVFDYNYKLIDYFNLDAFIGSVVVNEDAQELIGLDYSNENFELVYYSLEQLF